MFYIVGTGKEDIDLGSVHPQDCEVCQKEQPFRLRLVYRYEHLFFVLGNTRAKSYLLVCEVCGITYRIPRQAALKLARLDREPIPFPRKYGCLSVFLIILLLGLITVLLGND